MAEADRERWNRRYSEADPTSFEPCYALQQFQHLLPAQGDALDLACGLGGNALLMATRGLQTEAWDISEVALERLEEEAHQRGLSLTTRALEITPAALDTASFDVICVSRYLDRELCPAIVSALNPGGLLIYQTFTQATIDDSGPRNPSYRLGPNELLRLFANLELVAYREEGDLGDRTQGLRNEALLVARKPLR